MTLPRDPQRLLDPGSPTDPGLRDVLRNVHTALPTAAQLAALGRKLDAATAVSASASTPGHFAAVGALKLSIVLLALGAGAWFAWHARSPHEVASTGEVRAGHEVQPVHDGQAPVAEFAAGAALAQTTLPQPVPALLVGAPLAAQVAPHDAKLASLRATPPIKRAAPARVTARAAAVRADGRSQPDRVTAPAPQVPSDAPVPTSVANQSALPELTLLSRAQRLLAKDPRAALDAIDEHARAYPAGAFVEEREALAIDALRRLNRRQELQVRARAFLQRYPNSPHRERIETWLR